MKKLLIALLVSNLFLFAVVTSQSAQSQERIYDQVKLAEYTACLNANANFDIARMQVNGGNGSISPRSYVSFCKSLKP